MSGMEIVIRLLDLCNTFLEVLILYACAAFTCKCRIGWSRYIPYVGEFVAICFLTWAMPMDTMKIAIQMAVWCLLMKAVTRDRWRSLIVAFCISFYIITAISFVEMTASQLLFHNNSMMMGSRIFLIWQDYLLALVLKISAAIGLWKYEKQFRYEIRIKDAVMTGFVTLIFYKVCFSFGDGFFAGNSGWFDMAGAAAMLLFGLCFLLLIFFYKNNEYLKEQNLIISRQAKEANLQYQYYLSKEKQEEKVRSIYHDMKNYLLVLEGGQTAEETRRMAKRIRSEIADYENFIQSGNRFLDIILSDKAQKAKERQIDFSAFVDFSEVVFLDPLDISTIFGNGIDNALAACEKLPAEKRIVIVKGGRRQNLAMILIENNYAENTETRDEAFLHGFGIPNIKRAVQKYDGVCRITKKKGRFLLTVIIPFPVTG